MSGVREVRGTVRIEGGADAVGGVLRVMVEDVSNVDGEARVVGESVMTLSHAVAPDEAIPFAVSVDAPQDGASYIVRAHLDMDRSGELSAGDSISMVSHPVLQGDDDAPVEIVAKGI